MKKYSKFFAVLFFVLSFLTCVCGYSEESRPRLGLSVSVLQASPLLLQHLRLSEGEGLMVNNVVVGSEIEAAGLSQGDIVLSVNGHGVSSVKELQAQVSGLAKGTQVTLDVIQKGEHRQIYLKLDNLPDEIVWKYSQPVSGPGRSRVGSGSLSGGTNRVPGASSGHGGSQHMSIHSMISTPDGIKQTSVTIEGDPEDANSVIEIDIDSDHYQSKIGEIEQLPEVARQVAKDALSRRGSFSFSFGSFGLPGSGVSGGDIMDEMMRRHQEQMQMIDELFNRQFMNPGRELDVDEDKGSDVLKPVEPEKSDIRS